jgi:hypothetical protein
MVWAKALAKAGIGFRVTPHGLRHAHASWLLAGGADLQVVKERLGHGTITTTQRYLHTLPGADSAALAALDAVRGTRGTPGDLPQPSAGEGEGKGKQDNELTQMRKMLTEIKALLEGRSDTA